MASKNTLKSVLGKYGVAVVPRVLNDSECAAMVNGMWETLEWITQYFEIPIDRANPETWRSFYELFPLHSMLIQHWGWGHAQYVWDLRQNPKIVDIWKALWKTDKLLVSFDGVGCHLPPETTGRGWLGKTGAWLHTDQSYTRNEFECVQSWVTGLDVLTGDATLMVLEGSHLLHEEFAREFGKTAKEDWYVLEPSERAWYLERGCSPKCIKCPAGSMVFWDSRTIHCGQEPMKKRPKPNFRCIAYLCYTPADRATPSALEKKQKYLQEMRITSHWPHKIKVFAKYPRTYGKELPPVVELPSPTLTELGLELALGSLGLTPKQ